MRRLFSNKIMNCQNCGRKEWGKPNASSGWYHLELEGVGFYLCPECWRRGVKTPDFTAWLAVKFPRKED